MAVVDDVERRRQGRDPEMCVELEHRREFLHDTLSKLVALKSYWHESHAEFTRIEFAIVDVVALFKRAERATNAEWDGCVASVRLRVALFEKTARTALVELEGRPTYWTVPPPPQPASGPVHYSIAGALQPTGTIGRLARDSMNFAATLAPGANIAVLRDPPVLLSEPEQAPRRVFMIAYPDPWPDEPAAPEGTANERLCVVCLERVAVVAPQCGHKHSCVTCMVEHKPTACAICRQTIVIAIRIYE